MIHLALICGGPSGERGISLNSARSFLDHVGSLDLQLTVLYVNPKGLYYVLTSGQLYSNTPADFDFKLSRNARFLEEKDLLLLLRSMDLVFPLIHGAYGEDGALQEFLEEHKIPYVGSSSEVCRFVFNKYRAAQFLQSRGFPILPFLCIQERDTPIEDFWNMHQLEAAVIKPTESGSSIGVHYVDSIEVAKQRVGELFQEGFSELLIEPFSEGVEFTICVLENRQGVPVSLMPLEIENRSGKILDYRCKYLPSEQTRYHCPPRFEDALITKIREEAEHLFKVLGLRDFARLDGWVLPDGKIRFSDFNPISGMEQNSFLFQQAAQVGIQHTDLLEYILAIALARYGKKTLLRKKIGSGQVSHLIYVLMGGETAERHVSLMSGTNVFLKLMREPQYQVVPFLLGPKGFVWKLPYAYLLHHTVDEVSERCEKSSFLAPKAHPFVREIREKLGLDPISCLEMPECLELRGLIDLAKNENAFMFLALHGGIGEDGTIQRWLEEKKVPFNGSGAAGSSCNMDKQQTARCIASLEDSYILPMPQISFDALSCFDLSDMQKIWNEAQEKLGENLLIKPRCDGCSSGVVRLKTFEDFALYIECLQSRVKQIPAGTFTYQKTIVMMPTAIGPSFLLEPFIQTDRIFISGTELYHEFESGWCEMTICVLEKDGIYTAFNPSITVASGAVLSVEEKFQGGTGVNLTPPPEEILSEQMRSQVKERACKAAKVLGIQNYARLDLFVECKTGRIQVIEANTLPALTPSTVIYHQALAESPPIFPQEFLMRLLNKQ